MHAAVAPSCFWPPLLLPPHLVPGMPELRATTDRATPLNLAQHSYFNLGGHASGSILGHGLTLHG